MSWEGNPLDPVFIEIHQANADFLAQINRIYAKFRIPYEVPSIFCRKSEYEVHKKIMDLIFPIQELKEIQKKLLKTSLKHNKFTQAIFRNEINLPANFVSKLRQKLNFKDSSEKPKSTR